MSRFEISEHRTIQFAFEAQVEAVLLSRCNLDGILRERECHSLKLFVVPDILSRNASIDLAILRGQYGSVDLEVRSGMEGDRLFFELAMHFETV